MKRMMLLLLGAVLLLGPAFAEDHLVTLTYSLDHVTVSPSKTIAKVGDTVTFQLSGSGAMLISFILPFDVVTVRSNQPYTITVKYPGKFNFGCSALISGELEGWLAGDKSAGGELEVLPPPV